MHALLLRPSNDIYAAAALVHDADRPSPSAALVASAGSYAAHSEMLRTEKGRRKGTKSAQCNKLLDGSRGEALVMVALWNRADHYIFALWLFLSFFLFFFPRLISAIGDWMSAIHGVALVRI